MSVLRQLGARVGIHRTCADYDSTVKAMGFDEVRVRYRQERRTVVREDILRALVRDE